MILNELTGLVCIDCWESAELQDYYAQLSTRLNFNNFDSIVVANYELALDSINDLSQHNTLEEYSWTNYNPTILLDMASQAREKTSSKWLMEHFSTNTFLLLSIDGIRHHIENMVPHVKNWLVIGGAWGKCTHIRPISFKTLSSLDQNFYTAEWAVYAKDIPINFDNDVLQWKKHKDGLYQIL